jgi:protein pelota
MKLQVERVDFDVEQCSLRLTGKNVEENEFIKRGQYHTLELEIGHPFTIEKECWDSLYLQQLEEACDPSTRAELAAVVMQEGLAHVCLITNSMTLTRARIEKNISKKKQGADLDKAKLQFFKEIFDAIKKYINFEVVKAVLLGSPGFLKDDFMTYFEDQCIKLGDTPLLRQKAKFFKTHTSSGHKHSIEEILCDPALKSQLLDVKAAGEVCFQSLRFFIVIMAA